MKCAAEKTLEIVEKFYYSGFQDGYIYGSVSGIVIGFLLGCSTAIIVSRKS